MYKNNMYKNIFIMYINIIVIILCKYYKNIYIFLLLYLKFYLKSLVQYYYFSFSFYFKP